MEVLLMLATVLCGIDVLENENFDTLNGRNVGLITNHTGRTADGRYTADVLHEAENVNLVALFAPEHGIRGELDEENIGDLTDPDTGLPIYSLYNRASENRFRPSDEQLEGIDTIVFDIQDIGARFYTYVGTMGYAMEAATENDLKFVVLDRPNPINGIDVEGPVADEDYLGLTAFQPMPTRHGMTAGELALMFKDDLNLDLDLEVVWCENWRRDMYWDETGLTWVNPSPNMRTFTQALLYPGIALVEGTPISVGRGTDTPFELLGAPWMRHRELAKAINFAKIPGIRAYPITFTPTERDYAGELCYGVQFIVTDRDQIDAVRVGSEIAFLIKQIHGDDWNSERFVNLVQDRMAADLTLDAGYAVARLAWDAELQEFMKKRERYLHYD